MKDRSTLRKKLRIFIILSFFVLALELSGGLYTKSLSLLGDSFHVLFDLIALGLVYLSLSLSARKASANYTYGFYRSEIFSAILNGSLLVAIAGFLFLEAFRRLQTPSQVKAPLMLAISMIGFVANLIVVWGMHGYGKDNLNIRGAYLHVVGDALTSLGVVVGAVLILLTGIREIDPLVSILIGLVMLFGSMRLIRDSVRILMEAVPKGVDVQMMIGDIRSIKGVESVHDLHVWSISSDIRAASGHVLINGSNVGSVNRIIGEINEMLKQRHGIDHTVIQVECDRCVDTGAAKGEMVCFEENGAECHLH